jgi:tRNA(Met) C34 N-acetyltransferase TmcA
MIRVVLIALSLAAMLYLLAGAIRMAREARIDWRGVAFGAGFVVLAFWLRHVTGMG